MQFIFCIFIGNSGTNFEQNTSEKLYRFFLFQNLSHFSYSSYLVFLREIVKQCTCNFSNFVERLKGDIIKKHVQMLLASPQEFSNRH